MEPRHARFRTVATLVAVGAVALIAVAACAFSGTNESTAQSVCTPMGAFLETCSSTSACASAVASDCSEMSATLSDTLINNVVTCEQFGHFCDAGTVLASPCVLLAGVSPSAAQGQLAADFCAACSTAAASGCAATFYSAGGVGVASAPVFAAADPIVVSIDKACAGQLDKDAGSAVCTAAFVNCARPILQAQLVVPGVCSTVAGLLPPLPGDSE